MPQVKLREKGQVTIPAELLQEWSRTNQVAANDTMEVQPVQWRADADTEQTS